MSTSKKKSKSSSRRSRPGGGARPKPQIKHLKETLNLQEATIETLEEQLKERDLNIKSLQLQIEHLQRRLYGPKSDRPGDEAQLLLDEIMASLKEAEKKQDGEADGEEDEDGESDPKKRKKRAKPTGRKMFPSYIERVVEEVDLSDEEKIDPETGRPMAFIGWETRERLVEERARIYVQVLKRAKYAPVETGAGSEPGVVTAPVPAAHGNPIDRCKVDVSVLAKIIVSKYCYHLTLYRLQERYWRLGRVWLPRSTMCGWMAGCALALEPLYNAMARRIIESKYAALDDTIVKMLDPGAGKTATTRLWVYAGLLASAPYLVYDFTHTRAGKGPLEFLADFLGFVQGDAYSGHNATLNRPGVTGVGCWDHVRRYFVEASKEDPAAAARALAFIKLLYRVEREADDAEASAGQRASLRQEKAVPLLEKLKVWIDENKSKQMPNTRMHKAVNYCLNQWEELLVYTTDGNLPISNCLCEQSFKAIATGRKNWLFVGSEAGGRTAAILFSITMTCRRLDIDPQAYLEDILRRINTHPANRIDELLPDRWKAEKQEASEDVSLRLETHRPLRRTA
jgi:transposase/uncharacterized coiled-coil protein SlyX